MDIGRHEAAIPLLTRAAGIDPDNPNIKCDLALALMYAGRLQEADAVIYGAIASAPDYERSYRVRSIILRRGGRATDSLIVAKEAARLEPNSASALHVLAQAHLAANETKQAWEVALKVVQVAPESGDSHRLVGQVAIGLKQWKQAEQASLEALRLNPNDWAAMNNLGVAYKGQGRRVEAVQAYERAAQMNPSEQTARDNLVRTVRPIQPAAAAIDGLRMVLVPWLIPLVLVKWLVLWARSRGLQSELSAGGTSYYRSQTVGGAIGRLTGRQYGIVSGLIALLALAVPVPFVVTALAAANPDSPVLNGVIAFSAWVLIAAGIGALLGWRRSMQR
jgi:Flp pilus assembly protein TadD